jgi:hypothetical protein
MLPDPQVQVFVQPNTDVRRVIDEFSEAGATRLVFVLQEPSPGELKKLARQTLGNDNGGLSLVAGVAVPAGWSDRRFVSEAAAPVFGLPVGLITRGAGTPGEGAPSGR